jgi:hypothetical protein
MSTVNNADYCWWRDICRINIVRSAAKKHLMYIYVMIFLSVIENYI